MIHAIIFGPDERTGGEADERQLAGVKAHMRRRGYEFVGYACRWSMVVAALAGNIAQVVLFASDGRRRPAPSADETVLLPSPDRVWAAPAPRRALPAGPSRKAVATQLLDRPSLEEHALREETVAFVAGYRDGYADGFVDCIAMVRRDD